MLVLAALLEACVAEISKPLESGVEPVATDAGTVDPNAVAMGGTTMDAGTQIDSGTVAVGPPVVHPCSSLPAPGTWERINPGGTAFGGSQDVRVHPLESGTVYVDMHKGGNGAHYQTDGLYKSTDCGATWEYISVGRNRDAVTTGSWWSLLIDPVEPRIMYSINGYGSGGIWKSTNEGVDWDQMVPQSVLQYVPNAFTQALSMDPTDRTHLIATSHAGCTGPYAPNCMFETTDSGKTWRLVVIPTGNGEGAGPYILNPTTWLYAMPFEALWVTTDRGANWRKAFGSGAGAGNSLYRAKDGTYYLASLAGVLRSSNGTDWSVIPGTHRTVGLVGAGGSIVAADQWSSSYWSTLETSAASWTTFTTAGMPADSVAGAPFLDYDPGHHILYSSNWGSTGSGLWRIVLP
jgi:photosystem II stability/assembly factor-like uncharacterized protein